MPLIEALVRILLAGHPHRLPPSPDIHRAERHQAHARHPRRSRQLLLQLEIELRQPRLVIARRSRPRPEQNQIAPVEARIGRLDRRQVAREHHRRHHQHHRHGHLRHYEQPSGVPFARPRAHASRALLEPGRVAQARPLPRRKQPEHHQRHGCDRRGHRQDTRIQVDRDRQVPAPRQEPAQQVRRQVRHPDAGRPAQPRQQRALRQKLPHQAHLAAPQRNAHRHFLLAGHRPRQQQVRDVGAGEHQQQAHQPAQHQQGIAEFVPQNAQSAPAFVQADLRRGGGILGLPRPRRGEHRFQHRPQLSIRHARSTPGDQRHTPKPAVVQRIVAAQPSGVVMQWRVNLGRVARKQPLKLAFQHPRDYVWLVVDAE